MLDNAGKAEGKSKAVKQQAHGARSAACRVTDGNRYIVFLVLLAKRHPEDVLAMCVGNVYLSCAMWAEACSFKFQSCT